MAMQRIRSVRYALAVFLTLLSTLGVHQRDSVVAQQQDSAGPRGATAQGRGRSATRLADGRVLLVGGEGTEGSAWLWDLQTGTTTSTPGRVQAPRGSERGENEPTPRESF